MPRDEAPEYILQRSVSPDRIPSRQGRLSLLRVRASASSQAPVVYTALAKLDIAP